MLMPDYQYIYIYIYIYVSDIAVQIVFNINNVTRALFNRGRLFGKYFTIIKFIKSLDTRYALSQMQSVEQQPLKAWNIGKMRLNPKSLL